VKAEDLIRLQVIILIQGLEMGGAERQAVMLARELRRSHGIDARIWSIRIDSGYSKTRAVAAFCEHCGVPLHESFVHIPVNWDDWPNGLRQFADQLKAEKTDVILAYCSRANMVAGYIWRWTGAKTYLWGQRDEGRDRPPRGLAKLVVANTPWFISNSQDGVDFLTQRLDVPIQRIRKISNGIDTPPPLVTREQWREQLGIPQTAFAVAMIANLHRYKDHQTLLTAWRYFLNQTDSLDLEVRPISLVLAGHWYDTAAELRETAEHLGMGDTVIFPGSVSDVSGLLGAMDCCVHSSFKEGLPNAVLEAMHAGLPVIGTDIPGIRDALGDHQEHFLIPPKDALTLSNRLHELYRLDAETRARIGQDNQHRVLTHFSPEQLAEKTLNAINNALDDSKPHSMLGFFLQSSYFLRASLSAWVFARYLEKYLKGKLRRLPYFWRFAK
jgi:glycosyltransferase involved in cell wall biosynthesis